MKHEKVALVGLSYIIGFTTAFIAFGLPDISMHRTQPVPNQEASVNNAVSTKVVEHDDGLYVAIDGQERIVSALASEGQEGKEGFHNSIVTAQVSPLGDFVHFCTQVQAVDNFCLNYVYNLSSDSVHRVQNSDGEQVASLVTAGGSSWSNDNTLLIEGMESVSNETPWILQ